MSVVVSFCEGSETLSNSKTMSQTALLHGKMSEMDLSGSCYYNTA